MSPGRVLDGDEEQDGAEDAGQTPPEELPYWSGEDAADPAMVDGGWRCRAPAPATVPAASWSS
jgi:hypothetical protein